MEPSKFRESRVSINRLCDQMDQLIEQEEVDESRACFEQAFGELDELKPKVSGDIQERSVKNLAMKLKGMKERISKLKTKGTASSGSGSRVKNNIEWDIDRVAQLARTFLEKVLKNMAGDPESKVFFGTTGKGIRPNYQIQFKEGQIASFTGSGHKPKTVSPGQGAKNLSAPFSFQEVDAILNKTGNI
ncbi:hypothetical protein [Desulfobacter postgatei]|uniref:Uncharacterized protein n=1 Tax=Desulfobacter postgatei 2ac9 TaxID=879212 RepID=I5B6P3_9BACT|nr:hypothetical protein [Desulfobacter postgatei]EIM65156.1 hypothetical protein DespoDRAFT_03387 [Desulfobacter postgatei 2ac9]